MQALLKHVNKIDFKVKRKKNDAGNVQDFMLNYDDVTDLFWCHIFLTLIQPPSTIHFDFWFFYKMNCVIYIAYKLMH